MACLFLFFGHVFLSYDNHAIQAIEFSESFFMRHTYLKSGLLVCFSLVLSVFFNGCSVAEPKTAAETIATNKAAAAEPKGPTIKIEPNSPGRHGARFL